VNSAQAAIFVFFLSFIPANSHADRSLPVDNGIITSVRGYRKDPFGSGKMTYHSGVDIAAPVGTPVYPTQQGLVYFAGWYKGYGYLVAIDHGNSYVTIYGHNSRLLASPGQRVNTETAIALSGSTGRSTGPHVHYEVRRWPGGQSPHFRETGHPTHGQGATVVQHELHDGFSDSDSWIDKYVEGL